MFSYGAIPYHTIPYHRTEKNVSSPRGFKVQVFLFRGTILYQPTHREQVCDLCQSQFISNDLDGEVTVSRETTKNLGVKRGKNRQILTASLKKN